MKEHITKWGDKKLVYFCCVGREAFDWYHNLTLFNYGPCSVALIRRMSPYSTDENQVVVPQEWM